VSALIQTAARNVSQIKAAAAALRLTPAVTSALRAAVSQEAVAAASMSDDVFWGYDQAWLSTGAPTLDDRRKSGLCGGGGCNMTWDNNQFWSLAQACDRGVFSLVMFQQRRYMAAQLRLQRLLDLAPDRRILDGFDRYASSSSQGVRAACGGASPRERPTEWAAWCMDVLRVIGVLRWASNVTWSEGTAAAPDPLVTQRVTSYTGGAAGCVYAPDCMSDAFGVPRLGYVAGLAPNGMARFEALTGFKLWSWRPIAVPFGTTAYGPSSDAALLAAAASWRPDPAPQRVGWGVPWSVAPKALGLHKSSLSFDWVTSAIPTGMDDFDAVLLPDAVFPSLLRAPTAPGLFAWLSALFAEEGAPSAQLEARERTGAWWFMAKSNAGRDIALPTPASELIIWRVLAMLRDAVATSFGQAMVAAFQNVERAIDSLPEWAKSPALADVSAAMKSIFRAGQEQSATLMAGVFSAVGAVAAAINPIAGLVVSLVGALAVALTTFAMDLGIVRSGNPPALQFLAARQVAPVPGGEDRCWVNPGDETFALYKERVATPYAEAARRTGGDPSAMFDEIARVRAERAGLVPPASEAAPASRGAGWLAAAGGAAGFTLVRVLLGG